MRRVAAVVVTLTLLGLVFGDLGGGKFQAWWDRHSFTGSVVSSLLVLAVAGLVFDSIVARRQRHDRATSVAVQGLIVYGQARRAFEAVKDRDEAESGDGVAKEELRTLASMLLAASSSLFDDPEARRFLDVVERFTASMVHVVSASSGGADTDGRARLGSEMAQVQAAVAPLLARIPAEDRRVLEGPPRT
jgi:hypothetical protein